MGALGRPCGGNGRRDQPDPPETKKIAEFSRTRWSGWTALNEGEPMKIPVIVFLMLLYIVIFGWNGF